MTNENAFPDGTDRPRPGPSADPLGDAITAGRSRGRSSLRNWLEERFERLSETGTSIRDWSRLCALAEADGARDGRDRAPTPGQMSRIWYDVRRHRLGRGQVAAAPNLGIREVVSPPPLAPNAVRLPSTIEAGPGARETSSELACRYRTLPPPKGPVVITEEMRREGEAKAAHVLAELSAISHRKYGA